MSVRISRGRGGLTQHETRNPKQETFYRVVRDSFMDLEEPFQDREGVKSLARSSLTYWKRVEEELKEAST